MLQRGNLTSSKDKGRWSKIRYSTEDCGEEGKQKSGKNLAFLFLDAGEKELSTSHRKQFSDSRRRNIGKVAKRTNEFVAISLSLL